VKRNRVIDYVALYGLVVLGVHIFPGPWHKWEKNGAIDAWTVTHVICGAVGAWMGVDGRTMLALTVANEGVEAVTRKVRPDLAWGGAETPANVAMDVVTTMLGWCLLRQLQKKAPTRRTNLGGGQGAQYDRRESA
jgi:hypothetical protein